MQYDLRIARWKVCAGLDDGWAADPFKFHAGDQKLIFLNFLKATGAWSSSLEVELANFPGLKYFYFSDY